MIDTAVCRPCAISNAAIQDQETKFQDQETNAAMTGLDGAT
jgi:hypothetical protein